MRRGQLMMLMLGLAVSATPTVAQDKFELPFSSLFTRDGDSLDARGDNRVKMSFGSVGLDSHASDSRRHQYFNIPDERSFKKAPGMLFKIPLGN